MMGRDQRCEEKGGKSEEKSVSQVNGFKRGKVITPFQIDDLYTEEKGWRTEEEKEEEGDGETPEPERSSGCARGALRVTCNSLSRALRVTCNCVHEDFKGGWG